MRKLLASLAAATLLAGCSGDDNNPTQPPQSITLAVSSSTPTIAAGGSPASVNISVTRSTGFSGTIALTAEGLPTGVTASFAPATIPSDGTTSVMTLTAVAAVPPGNTTFTVRAKGGSAADATQSLTLSVTAAAVVGVSFTTGADSLVVKQGDSATVAVRLTRTGGFSAPVAFAVDSLPTGVTTTFTPVSPIAGDSTRLQLKVAPTVASGTYSLRLRSTTTGQSDSTRVIRLIVSATGAITLTAATPTLTLAPGDSGVATVVVRRTSPFAGVVTLTADSLLPAGLVVRGTPFTVNATTDTARLTIVASGTATPGTRTLRLNASGTGVGPATATISVVVQAPPTIAFAITPDTLSLNQGAAGQARIAITRSGGFTGPITFVADTIPNGVTALFTPASPVAGDTTTLVVSTLSSVVPGTYTLSIRATGTGVASVRKNVRLTVKSAGAIALALIPDTLAVAAGDSVVTTVRVTRTAPFAGVVKLALDSILPVGVRGRLRADSLLATQDSTTLVLYVADSVAASKVTVAVRATGVGVLSSMSTATITVSGFAGYRLLATPAILTVAQNRAGIATLNVSRAAGFNDQVVISVRGLPAGVTATNFNTPITTQPGTVQFAVGNAVPPGDYIITIDGSTASGVSRSATFTLRVVP